MITFCPELEQVKMKPDFHTNTLGNTNNIPKLWIEENRPPCQGDEHWQDSRFHRGLLELFPFVLPRDTDGKHLSQDQTAVSTFCS